MKEQVNKEAVAFNMKLIRNLTGKSMQDFGIMLGGLSKDQIHSYENNRALPQETTIQRVCQLADITRKDLLTKKLTEEEVVKEMFLKINVQQENESPNQRLAELKMVISEQRLIIETQRDMIKRLQEMLATIKEEDNKLFG
jgi:transcriptional regulator with XRE-family HTH domain